MLIEVIRRATGRSPENPHAPEEPGRARSCHHANGNPKHLVGDQFSTCTDRCILGGRPKRVCCLRPRIILLDGIRFPCDAANEQGCSGSSCRSANGRAAIPNRLSQPDWSVMPTDHLDGSPPLSPSPRRSRCRRFRLPHGCAASSAFHVGRRRHVRPLRSRAKVFLESSCGSLVAIIKRRQRPRTGNGAWNWSRLGDAHLAMRARRDSPGVGASVEPPSYTDAPRITATWRIWRSPRPG
jgi:hypothetical protein